MQSPESIVYYCIFKIESDLGRSPIRVNVLHPLPCGKTDIATKKVQPTMGQLAQKKSGSSQKHLNAHILRLQMNRLAFFTLRMVFVKTMPIMVSHQNFARTFSRYRYLKVAPYGVNGAATPGWYVLFWVVGNFR